MSRARFIVGDVFQAMADIPDASVDLIVTSPPFLALRSYLPADHPHKHLEIGSEATPAAFLGTLLALTREWRRILAPHGSLCVELGDTYSGPQPLYRYTADHQPTQRMGGSHKVNSDGSHAGNEIMGEHNIRGRVGPGWPLDKSLCLIPSLYAGSLAYGWNMLDPFGARLTDEQIDPWRVRNLIVWHRPNPPVGALGDKVRPSTSYITVACTSRTRWFDLDSERTAYDGPPPVGGSAAMQPTDGTPSSRQGVQRSRIAPVSNPAGAPPLDCWTDIPEADVWTIPTAPYPGAHYATFPPALPRKLINLMCPRQVCTQCGEPRRRIVGEAEYVKPNGNPHIFHGDGFETNESGANRRKITGADNGNMARVAPTLGWSDCGHDTWRRGIVCDPFAGSGTTLQAASELGRDSIGIDLDPRNLDLARQRCGMFLEEEEATA